MNEWTDIDRAEYVMAEEMIRNGRILRRRVMKRIWKRQQRAKQSESIK